MCFLQCSQPAYSSAAKHKRGWIKMYAAGQTCGQILARFSQKGPKRSRILQMFFFQIKELKTWNFHRFLLLYGFKILSYFDKMVMKTLFLQKGRNFLPILVGKCWKELATLCFWTGPAFLSEGQCDEAGTGQAGHRRPSSSLQVSAFRTVCYFKTRNKIYFKVPVRNVQLRLLRNHSNSSGQESDKIRGKKIRELHIRQSQQRRPSLAVQRNCSRRCV